MERQQQSFHLEIFEMNENGNILDEIGLFWGKYSTVLWKDLWHDSTGLTTLFGSMPRGLCTRCLLLLFSNNTFWEVKLVRDEKDKINDNIKVFFFLNPAYDGNVNENAKRVNFCFRFSEAGNLLLVLLTILPKVKYSREFSVTSFNLTPFL